MQQRHQVLYQTQELHPCTGLWSRGGILKMWGTAGTSGRWLASRGEFILHLNLGWVWCWFVCPPAAPTAEVHVHMSKAGSSFGGQQLASIWSNNFKMWKQRRFGNRVCRRGREEKVFSESGEWLATGNVDLVWRNVVNTAVCYSSQHMKILELFCSTKNWDCTVS